MLKYDKNKINRQSYKRRNFTKSWAKATLESLNEKKRSLRDIVVPESGMIRGVDRSRFRIDTHKLLTI